MTGRCASGFGRAARPSSFLERCHGNQRLPREIVVAFLLDEYRLIASPFGDDEAELLRVLNHSFEILNGSCPVGLTAWDLACIGHGDVRPLRRPPVSSIASEEICLPWQGHDLG